jgi:excisionase family DNA binding protein
VTATNPAWRAELRSQALRTAMAKRAAGVPTYSVPEAAALLSVSQEHLYRLIHADAFPAVRMALSGSQGRYVIPARAVERLLGDTDAAGRQVEVAEWTATYESGGPHRKEA